MGPSPRDPHESPRAVARRTPPTEEVVSLYPLMLRWAAVLLRATAIEPRDVVHNAIVRGIKKHHVLRTDEPAGRRAWWRAIVRNEAVRQIGYERSRSTRPFGTWERSIAAPADLAEIEDDLAHRLRLMTANQRVIVAAIIRTGSTLEAARYCGVSRRTAQAIAARLTGR